MVHVPSTTGLQWPFIRQCTNFANCVPLDGEGGGVTGTLVDGAFVGAGGDGGDGGEGGEGGGVGPTKFTTVPPMDVDVSVEDFNEQR